MGLRVNLRWLQKKPVELQGQLGVEEFAADYRDELVRMAGPLEYDLEVAMQGEGEILVRGRLAIGLSCDCARCLKTFEDRLEIPEFAALAALEGEEALPRDGDFADLTGLVREDILLGLPTNPLCSPECPGLAKKPEIQDMKGRVPGGGSADGSPWSALDRLKL